MGDFSNGNDYSNDDNDDKVSLIEINKAATENKLKRKKFLYRIIGYGIWYYT